MYVYLIQSRSLTNQTISFWQNKSLEDIRFATIPSIPLEAVLKESLLFLCYFEPIPSLHIKARGYPQK